MKSTSSINIKKEVENIELKLSWIKHYISSIPSHSQFSGKPDDKTFIIILVSRIGLQKFMETAYYEKTTHGLKNVFAPK